MSVAISLQPLAEGLGARLRALREARGLTQRQLAKKAGIDPGYLAVLETGRIIEPRKKTRERLAEALDLELADLESNPNPKARSWKSEFLADPRYSKETKQVIIRLVEDEERRLLRQRRK